MLQTHAGYVGGHRSVGVSSIIFENVLVPVNETQRAKLWCCVPAATWQAVQVRTMFRLPVIDIVSQTPPASVMTSLRLLRTRRRCGHTAKKKNTCASLWAPSCAWATKKFRSRETFARPTDVPINGGHFLLRTCTHSQNMFLTIQTHISMLGRLYVFVNARVRVSLSLPNGDQVGVVRFRFHIGFL